MHRARVIVLLAAGATAAACVPRGDDTPVPEGALVERSHATMGASVRLTAWTADEAAAVGAFDAVFAEFDRLDALLSVWKRGSDIVRLNEAAGRAPVPVSEETRRVLRTAAQVGGWTRGKFDVTFAALADVWRFDHDQDNAVPTAGAIARRLPLIDSSALVVDERAGTALLSRPGMRAHLGGIGKGYAVDRAAAILRSRRLTDFLIESGGDMYVAGRRGDRPWRVGIRDPRGPAERSFAAIDLTAAAISTSGDYERFFMTDGQRFHHIIDPDTGQPARLNRSVTIFATESILADALATGVFLLPPDEGMALIERLDGVEGVLVTARNEVRVSSGIKERLVRLAAPTDAP